MSLYVCSSSLHPFTLNAVLCGASANVSKGCLELDQLHLLAYSTLEILQLTNIGALDASFQ